MVAPTNTTTTTENTNQVLTSCTAGENYSAQEGAFEGPEKLLEIWFSPTSRKLMTHQHIDKKTKGLMCVPRDIWEDMLAIVKCTVLNVISHDQVDAYLLSESSMFIYPHKLIIKTCGTTTLLLAIPRILEVAKKYCSFEKVWRVFYSRKAFMFPERQIEPHTSWENEVEFLDRYFDDGAAYKIGKMAGDHWHLYTTKPSDDVLHHLNQFEKKRKRIGELHEETISSGYSTPAQMDSDQEEEESKLSPFGIINPSHGYQDQTVEILMTKLNPKNMEKFYHQIEKSPSGIQGGKYVDQITGIKHIYPSADIDSYLFEPCGYSSNGLWEDRYFTIHVTPEPQCSYASFETNIPVSQSHHQHLDQLVQQVIDIFDPASFTVTLFTSHVDDDLRHQRMIRSMNNKMSYQRTDRILYEFDGYDLVYGHYVKK
ncbi:unnamed protein product [Cunninghamella blakesleeana]